MNVVLSLLAGTRRIIVYSMLGFQWYFSVIITYVNNGWSRIHSWGAKFEQFVNLSSVIIFESCNRGQFRNLEVECAGKAGEIVH